MLSEKDAKKKLSVLMEQLHGGGWEPHLWENLGWHYCAKNGETMRVYPGRVDYKAYTCFIGDGGGGNYNWTTKHYFPNPNDAVKHEIKQAKLYVESLGKLLTDIDQRLVTP